MISYNDILLLSTITIIFVNAKKDDEYIAKQVSNVIIQSNDDIDINRQSEITWSPTTSSPPNSPFPTYTSGSGISIDSLSPPTTTPVIPILSPEECAQNLPCSIELSICTDGSTESCCGITYESLICNCENSLDTGELEWACYATDNCLFPNCDDEEPVLPL